VLRKAKAELEAEAAADHARQRERKACCAEQQAAAQTVTRSGTTDARSPRDLDARGRMDRKIRSKAGQAIDALRKIIAEPMFGQIKAIRGLDRFLLWGTERQDQKRETASAEEATSDPVFCILLLGMPSR
jgi:hypothetical protein